MLNLEGLRISRPLRVVTVGTGDCKSSAISRSSSGSDILCWLISQHLRSLPECPIHRVASAIAGPHNDSICLDTFSTSAELSPCICIMALVGERDLIAKGPLNVLNCGSTLSIILITNIQFNFFTTIIKLLLASLCRLDMLFHQLSGLFKFSFKFLAILSFNNRKPSA